MCVVLSLSVSEPILVKMQPTLKEENRNKQNHMQNWSKTAQSGTSEIHEVFTTDTFALWPVGGAVTKPGLCNDS